MIGTKGKNTEPEALQKLNKIGELRLLPGKYRLFHPKVYLFYGPTSFAWVGSANFTRRGGFAKQYRLLSSDNEETLFETESWCEVASWFERRWHQCQPLLQQDIDDYIKKRKEKNTNEVTVDVESGNVAKTRLDLFRRSRDWGGYVKAVQACNETWLADRRSKFSVIGKDRSWMHTISEIRPIAQASDWGSLEAKKRNMLFGQTSNNDPGVWALLGNLRGVQISRLNRNNAKFVESNRWFRISGVQRKSSR